MELLQLKYFKTVAEIGKISEAAKALFISAPALSTSISRLEREMGMELFDRSYNKITLNRQGQILLRYVNQVFSTLDCAKVEMQQSLYQQGRHVFIASVSSTPWVDLVTNFTQEYPDFTLSCTSVRRSDLQNHGMPAKFNFLLASCDDLPAYFEASLDCIDLYRDEPMVMVHKNHPLAKKDSVSLLEIINEPLFLPMQEFDLYKHLLVLFDRCGIPFPGGNAYSHLATQQLVSKGLGIGFTSKAIVRTPTLPLVYLPIREPCPPWTLRLYWRKDQVFSEDELVFKEFVERAYCTAH
ncbi:MAG: LysR family transcriptional regulator [Oscillospiraceae bacterium]|nr:LysR family transcriptional regulator [Oscillospiraceae bacterium]